MSKDKGKRPLVFIGSSVENLEVAEALQARLRHECEAWVWDQGIFNLNESAIESLEKAIGEKKPDFAIFVVCGEDLTESRGETKNSPRDNIIFELGLFTGAIGKERVYMVVDEASAPKIPTDLSGIKTAQFKRPERSNIEGALGPACWDIKTMIRRLGLRSVNHHGPEMEILELKKRIDELILLLEREKVQIG